MPFKSKLTSQLIEAAAVKARDGLPQKFIAAQLGIDESTLSRWMSRGAGETHGLYRKLYLEMKKADAEWVESHMSLLKSLGSQNPRTIQWLMSRLHPDVFGRRDNVEPISMEDRAAQAQSVRELLMERLARLLPEAPEETKPEHGADAPKEEQ